MKYVLLGCAWSTFYVLSNLYWHWICYCNAFWLSHTGYWIAVSHDGCGKNVGCQSPSEETSCSINIIGAYSQRFVTNLHSSHSSSVCQDHLSLYLSLWSPPQRSLSFSLIFVGFIYVLSISGVIFSPASGGFAPRPPPGLCHWSRFTFTV